MFKIMTKDRLETFAPGTVIMDIKGTQFNKGPDGMWYTKGSFYPKYGKPSSSISVKGPFIIVSNGKFHDALIRFFLAVNKYDCYLRECKEWWGWKTETVNTLRRYLLEDSQRIIAAPFDYFELAYCHESMLVIYDFWNSRIHVRDLEGNWDTPVDETSKFYSVSCFSTEIDGTNN